MRTTDFDLIATSAPLDAQASIVRDGSGDHWEGSAIMPGAHWSAPPPQEQPAKPGLPNLTGHKLGRLTVVRFHGYSGISDPRAIWLVRCQCGDYETRRHSTITKNTNPDACCWKCEEVKRLQLRASKPVTKRDRRQQVALLERMAGR